VSQTITLYGAPPTVIGLDAGNLSLTGPAGSYTLQLSGVNGSTGVGLVEVYLIP